MILIGTIHIDPRGAARLEHALEHFAPKRIGIEIPDGCDIAGLVDYMTTQRIEFLTALEQMEVAPCVRRYLVSSTLAIGYEASIPFEYAQRTGAELRCYDHPALMENAMKLGSGWVAGLDEAVDLLTRKVAEDGDPATFPANYILSNIQRNIDDTYEVPDRLVELTRKGIEKLSPADLEKVQKMLDTVVHQNNRKIGKTAREDYIAEGLARDRPDVYICGLGHLSESSAIWGPGFVPIGERLKHLITGKLPLSHASRL